MVRQAHNAGSMHIWWECGKLKVFWRHVHAIVQVVLRKELPWTPRIMLLADLVNLERDSPIILVADMLVAAATMLIASKWRTPEIPIVGTWLSKVRFMGMMAKITAICGHRAGNRNAMSDLTQQWRLCSKYLGFSQSNLYAQVLVVL